MVEPSELSRLIREANHRADTARRSGAYMLQLVLGLVAFGLAPLVPGAGRIFGVLTATEGLAIIAPGLLAAWVSVLLFRRGGSNWRVYQASESIESLLLFGASLAMIFVSRTTWSVLWILGPFTTVFWANAKPFHQRVYVPIIVLSHCTLVAAYFVRGDADAATAQWLAIAVGLFDVVIYEGLARRGRSTIRLEAERNVLQTKLDSARLDEERDRIARMLRERVGTAVSALANELASDELEAQARLICTALDGVQPAPVDAWMSVADLARTVDERCGLLCVDVAYARSTVGDEAARVDGRTAHALVRVSQELVRNAVTHGGARRISVELQVDGRATTLLVRDDGVGLAQGSLSRATGGLHNVRKRLADLAGLLEQHVIAGPRGGTELRAIVPHPADAFDANDKHV